MLKNCNFFCGEIFAVKPFWPNEIYVRMVGAKCARDCCSGRLFRKVWIQFLLPNKLFYTHTYMQSVFLCPNITTMWPKKLWIHILRFAIFKYGELFLMPRSQQHTLCMCEAPRNLWSGCSPSIRDVILGVFLVSNVYTNIYRIFSYSFRPWIASSLK